MLQRSNVCRVEPMTKAKFGAALATGWLRVRNAVGRGTMADLMGLDEARTVDRGISGETLPAAHTIFNSLCADPTALDELLAEYGYKLCPLRAEPANDLATLSGLCETAGEMADALKDGVRHHTETLQIADKLRRHMPALTSIMREADELRAMRS